MNDRRTLRIAAITAQLNALYDYLKNTDPVTGQSVDGTTLSFEKRMDIQKEVSYLENELARLTSRSSVAKPMRLDSWNNN